MGFYQKISPIVIQASSVSDDYVEYNVNIKYKEKNESIKGG